VLKRQYFWFKYNFVELRSCVAHVHLLEQEGKRGRVLERGGKRGRGKGRFDFLVPLHNKSGTDQVEA
jgi:hypothetical protein